MYTALTIAGSDPTGGAGLQADLRVFQHFGVHGCGAVTALTLQDSRGVKDVLPVFPSVLLDQLRILLGDITPDAIKIGMLATDDGVRNVHLALSGIEARLPIVLDPILSSSNGRVLLEERAQPALRELIGTVELVTPNLPEAEVLTRTDVSTAAGVEKAARRLVGEIGATAALIKGGHRDGRPDDLLALRDEGSAAVSFRWLRGTRIDVGEVHGTGCALASAITANRAKGHPLEEAVDQARAFVATALERAELRGGGLPFLVYG